MKIMMRILFMIASLFLFSCKENVKRQEKSETKKDTARVYTKKVETSNVCNKKIWIKNYIENLGSPLVDYNEKNIFTRDFGNLLLEKQNFYIGYIGSNKKRLKITFTLIKKNNIDGQKYHINGFTIVDKNKRFFKGYLKIDNVYGFKKKLYGVDDWMKGKIKDQGIVVAQFNLKEDSQYSATGIFEGKCIIRWYVDVKNILKYDDIEDDSDSYSNNQFIGTWTSYKSNKSRQCSWGQYRIPCSNDLDVGAAEFSPNPKYFKYGWNDYVP